MANVLPNDKQVTIIGALAEGNSICSRFDLHGHPKTHRVYAWAHETDLGDKRNVTVLHIPPAVSPETAVRAAIVQEFGDAQTA
jgi:hypothetical protein